MKAILIASVEELLSGRLKSIDPDTKVTELSIFSDRYWDARTGTLRLNSVSKSKLCIDWVEYGFGLNETLLLAIKIYAFLLLTAAKAVRPRSTRSMLKPHTVFVSARDLCNFFRHLNHQEDACLSIEELIPSILVRGLDSFDRKCTKNVKLGLQGLTRPAIHMLTGGLSTPWSIADLRQMHFWKSNQRDDYERVFPSEMVQVLLNRSSEILAGFLDGVGYAREDNSSAEVRFGFTDRSPGIAAEMYRAYVSNRLKKKKRWNEKGFRTSVSNDGKLFATKFDISHQQYLDYLRDVQAASLALIALLTGGRYSDQCTFKQGCITTVQGFKVLSGTSIKNESLFAQEGEDYWPAIPLMRDAIAALEMFCEFTFNPFLESSLDTISDDQTPAPFTLQGAVDMFSRYLQRIDTFGKFKNIKISSHRFRHTLANQLARQDVGLVLVAWQLKQLYLHIEAMPKQTTLGYGGVVQLIAEKALQADSHNEEIVRALFHPDSPIAGGGAEEFKKRRRTWFTGMAARGFSVDQLIALLVRQGNPLSSVVMAYCSGRRNIPKLGGGTMPPPCLGSLECTPNKCQNAVITREHAVIWAKIESQNKSLAARDDMAYARSELLSKAEVATQVLKDLESVL